MSAIADRFGPLRPAIGPRARSALAALGIAFGGLAAGVLGLLLVRPLVELLGVAETEPYRLLAGNQIQVGFAAFGLGYLALCGDRGRYLRVRTPGFEDLAWIVAGQPLVVYLSIPVAAATGLLLGHPTYGGASEGIELAENLHLWPVALVGMYLFAAPAEELVYRGLVQGRLREDFDTAGVVALGGLLFGVLHLLVGLLTPGTGLAGALQWGISATVPGLVWGLAYERTENLLVTSTLHAISWTVPVEAALPFV